LPIQHDARAEGKSSYNFKRLFKLALDTIIAFSDKPMRLIVKFGFVITMISLLVGLVYLLQYLRGEIVVMGYASLIISLCAFSGVIISILGIIGLYIGKMFETVKNRPVFIVSNALNVEK
jgi:dolichol-phosphate mannosyltransferase